MSANIDTNLKKYLSNNLGPTYYQELLLYSYISVPSVLATISLRKLPSNVLHLIKEFLKNLSPKEMSEYINRTTICGSNILFFCKDVELMKDIIEHVRDINSRNVADCNALMAFCNYDDVEIIELLLDKGINIDAQDIYGYTLLMRYCDGYSPTNTFSNDNFESIVELLVYRDANLLIKSPRGQQAWELVRDPILVSEELLQLLRGEISIGRTKSAANVCVGALKIE